MSWRERVARALTEREPAQTIGGAFAAKRREAVEAKAVPVIHYPAAAFDLVGNPYRRPDEQVLSGVATYAVSVLAYACMSFRATTFTEAPLWVLDETDDGEEWLRGAHVLERLLERPNPDMEASEFWELVSLYLDAPGGGACLLVKNRDNAGRVAQLYPYSKGEFTVEPANGRLFGRFRVMQLGGATETYQPEDVIYLRETDPRDPWGALSPGDAALRDLNLSERQRAAVLAAFRNTVMPGSVTTVPDNLSDEQFERWRMLMNERAGAANAGRDLLIEKGGSWQQVKASLKDLDLGPLSDRLEATICAAYKVNPLLLGLHSATAMNGGLSDSLEPAMALYYRLAQIPRWRRIASKMTDGLLREVEPGNLRRFLRFDTSGVAALQEDLAAKVETAAKATFWTRSEQRAYTGMDPDVPPDPAPASEGDSGQPESTAPKSAPPSERKAVSDADVAWMLFDAVAQTNESALRLVAANLLAADRDAIVGLVRAGEKAGTAPERKETVRPLTPEEIEAIEAAAAAYLAERSTRAWRERMTPALRLVAEGAVERVAASVGVSFDVLQEGLLEVVEERAGFLIRSVSDTTRDAVRRALRDGLAAGESIPDLARRISDAAGFSQERATLIARTESTAMTNLTQRTQLQAYATRSGRKVIKTWLTARDARVRDEHAALEGQVRAIDQAFSNGELQPGAPNCYLPGTLVQGRFVGGVKAEYSGEVVRVRTAGGRDLTVTPNHPVLTVNGFVPAHALREGVELLGYAGDIAGLPLGDQDEYNAPAPIEQVFRALELELPSLRRLPAIVDLHGDAARVQGDIHVVGPHGVLLADSDPTRPEGRGDLVFVLPAPQEAIVSRLGAGDLGLEGVNAVTGRLPSSGALTLNSVSVGFELRPFEPLRVGPAANLHASLYKSKADGTASEAEALGDGLLRLAGEVGGNERVHVYGETASTASGANLTSQRLTVLSQPLVEGNGVNAEFARDLLSLHPAAIQTDHVVAVEILPYAGHVYDLQSVGGWKIANGVVTSNCRCTLVYTAEEAA